MQGVILAAGKGSRLHPITLKRSKAMLPILGRPMVERVMETIRANGIRDFILVVSGDDRDIVRYFADECAVDVQVRFVVQEERLGMADALRRAAPLINGPFLLSACDNLTSPEHVGDLLACRRAHPESAAVLSVMPIPDEEIGRTGIVALTDGRVTRIVEKPSRAQAPSNIASLPLYVFSPRILDHLPNVRLSPRGEYELQDAIQALIDEGGPVYPVFIERRLTVTGPADLLAINKHYLMAGGDRPQLAPFTVGPNTHLITPLRIEEGTVIGRDSVIGPRVYIERDCRIGDGVGLRDAVVLRGAVVPDGASIANEVVS
ncbi:MAG: NDP-sugar synthase [Anaerolineae bacterium]|nr:NDP-sugar synthase [Anaerolineae bacterium]